MTTKAERYQSLWYRYEREHERLPASARDVIEWGVRAGIIELPSIDPYDVLAVEMAKALREEFATDAKGRRYRVNHAVRVTRGGVQYTFWERLGYAPKEHMVRAFNQRREQIVSDCVQLKIDVDVYNDMNHDSEPVQLVLDFRDDVSERLDWNNSGKKAA
jgi:hypothetical protein